MGSYCWLGCAPVIVAAAFSGAASAGEVAESWVDRLDGPAGMSDYGQDVAFAADGSVYVAGFVFQQVSAGLFAPRFMTVKYDSDGTRLWTQMYAGTFASGAAAAYHLVVDADGDVIVSGATNQGADWAVVKYDPSGAELWRSVYAAGSTFLTQPADMAVDALGNIYLVGVVGDLDLPDAATLVKFTAAGEEEFVRQYYGPTSQGASFAAVTVDGEGNMYAAGSSVVPMLASELSVVKYDPAGTVQWEATAGSTGELTHDRATEVALDSAGDIIAVGAFGFNSFQGVDLAVVKFDAAGKEIWRELYAGETGGSDAAAGAAITGADEIVAIGYTQVDSGDYDALTLKYDAAGALQWERRVAGKEIYPDRAAGVALDADDNIYVAGEYDPIGGSRFFTVRYDPDGTERWFMDYAGPMGGGSGARAIAAGPGGSVAVTGDSPHPTSDLDITTIRYEQGAEPLNGDLDGDGVVGFSDLIEMLSAWGACSAPPAECPADLDGDGVVGFSDLIVLLANWT